MADIIQFPRSPQTEDESEANLMCAHCDDGIVFQLTDSGAWCLSCGSLNDWDQIMDTVTEPDEGEEYDE